MRMQQLGKGLLLLSPLQKPLNIHPFIVTLMPVATRSAISVDLSGTYWLTFISSIWKLCLMLTIYWTAKMEWLCQPWLEGQGVTVSLLQGWTQKVVQENHNSGLYKWKQHSVYILMNQPRGKMLLPGCSLTSVCWGVGCRPLAKFTSFQNVASIFSEIKFSRPDHISPLPVPCLCVYCSTWLVMCDDTVINPSPAHTYWHTHISIGLCYVDVIW